jgi:hypothetical protein
MLTPEMRLELVQRHGEREAAGDMEATLATLEPDPVYYFFPAGRKFRGLSNVRRFYGNLFTQGSRYIEGFELLNQWANDTSSVVEYSVRARHDDGLRTHRIICIYTFGPTAMSGEIMYADEALFRIMAGPLWDEMELA